MQDFVTHLFSHIMPPRRHFASRATAPICREYAAHMFYGKKKAVVYRCVMVHLRYAPRIANDRRCMIWLMNMRHMLAMISLCAGTPRVFLPAIWRSPVARSREAARRGRGANREAPPHAGVRAACAIRDVVCRYVRR